MGLDSNIAIGNGIAFPEELIKQIIKQYPHLDTTISDLCRYVEHYGETNCYVWLYNEYTNQIAKNYHFFNQINNLGEEFHFAKIGIKKKLLRVFYSSIMNLKRG